MLIVSSPCMCQRCAQGADQAWPATEEHAFLARSRSVAVASVGAAEHHVYLTRVSVVRRQMNARTWPWPEEPDYSRHFRDGAERPGYLIHIYDMKSVSL